MKRFKKICRSVLSGTIAMAIVSSNALLPSVVHGASVEDTDVQLATEIERTAKEGYDTEGSIIYIANDMIEADSIVLSTANAAIAQTTTATSAVKTVKASMAEENGYRYYITGGYAIIDSYIGDETNVEIPVTLGGAEVTEIGYAAFAGNKKIVKVKLPETIKKINHDAFSGCTSLVNAELSEGITNIQDGAFSDCASLNEISIPDGVSRIEDNVFKGCKALTNIKLNSNIDYIGKSSFAYCSSLSSVEIPESVTAIGNMAFMGSGLVNFDVPDTVTSMGYAVFADCAALEEIRLPKEITKLKSGSSKGMFSGCTSLKNVTFPDVLTEIGDSAFAGCSSLESISIPDTVTTIGTELFRGCEKLINAEIPMSVTRIEDGMFSGCASMPSIDLHDDIVYIGNRAFENCSALDNMTVPKNTAVIGECCFLNCESLTEIDIPASVNTLGKAALAGCSSLKKATLPDSIEELSGFNGVGLFTNDIALNDVKLPATLKTIGAYTFSNCLSLEKIDLPDTVSLIGGNAFESCISLKEISLPKSVVTLYDKTFSGCTTLTKVILPEKFDEAKNYAFENCTSLNDLGKKSGFFKFAEDTFAGCSSLSDERATVFTNDTPVVNVSSAANIVGGIANFSIKYDLNDWISSDLANNGNVSFEVPMPSGLSLIESSVISDSDDNKVTYAGNNSLIMLSKPEGTLRFSARIEAYNENAYIIDPKIHFNSHSYNWTQKIPRMSLTVPKITISAQSTVSSLECDVFGIAEPGRKVKIYVDGKLAASVTSNQYTGKYVATVSLPEKKDSEQYSISAVCGVDKTDEIGVVYSNAKPSIKKVDLIYCTHAPSDINDYMETLDITGVFTKGEHPVIQYYPKGNMRFRIEAYNSDRISFILVRSKKGAESKYLIASYDEKEKAWITPEDQYFDETDHNYVPGSLNFIIVEKTDDIIDAEEAEELMEDRYIEGVTRSYDVIDDSSCICRLEDEEGGIGSECYYYCSEAVNVNGKKLSASAIAESPDNYGFKKSAKKVLRDGVLFSIYLKTTYYDEKNESTSGSIAAYDNAVLKQVDEAYKKVGKLNYDMEDYTVFSQVMVADDGSTPAYIYVTADAQIFEEEDYIIEYSRDIRPIQSVTLYETVVQRLPGITMLSNENDENADGDEDEETIPEYLKRKAGEFANNQAKKKADKTVKKILKNKPNALKTYEGANKAKKVYKKVKDYKDEYDNAKEEEEEVKSTDWGSEEWNKYRDSNAELEKGTKMWMTFESDVTQKVPVLGKFYSETLGRIKDQLDDLFDRKRNYYKSNYADLDAQIAAGEEYDPEYEQDGQLKTVVDPSGIVYEGIKSKTVSGAVVTCYMFNEDTGAWEVWNAEDYDQANPILTDEAGSYAWDVPEGRYYVTCEKEGYDLIKSEEFAVAPPKFDLDFNLLNESAPSVNGYTLSENTITIEFTKVMDIATLNKDSVAVSGISGDITIEPQLYSDGDKFTDKFIISGDFSKATKLKLSVNSKASDYTGAAVAEYSADIDNIYADLILEKENIKLVAEDTYQIKANKEIASFTSSDPKIAAVDNKGIVTAGSAGSTKITAVDSNGKEAVLTVAVEKKVVVDEATSEKLKQRSLKDYSSKTGITADSAECKVVDNKCVVELKDKDGNVIEVYTIDPETGIGTDSNGKVVNLPQTGNNSMINWLWVITAIALICNGLFFVRRSGAISRKRS
ncbi:leucine-rich repeat protein [Ruminococcus flavefaciens]|uniref:leucine-rich repeat protein n=1 Tax=Ruminococcus flavefaciens TaxID=1265 RepID=UPI00048BCF03|nr:leucine-rich repeat protein [Ruminococcus flavefaciens]